MDFLPCFGCRWHSLISAHTRAFTLWSVSEVWNCFTMLRLKLDFGITSNEKIESVDDQSLSRPIKRLGMRFHAYKNASKESHKLKYKDCPTRLIPLRKMREKTKRRRENILLMRCYSARGSKTARLASVLDDTQAWRMCWWNLKCQKAYVSLGKNGN